MSITKLDVIQRIVNQHQYEKVTWTTPSGKQQKLVIDATTASAMLTIHDALSTPNQSKFLAYEWPRVAELTWKLLSKYGKGAS